MITLNSLQNYTETKNLWKTAEERNFEISTRITVDPVLLNTIIPPNPTSLREAIESIDETALEEWGITILKINKEEDQKHRFLVQCGLYKKQTPGKVFQKQIHELNLKLTKEIIEQIPITETSEELTRHEQLTLESLL